MLLFLTAHSQQWKQQQYIAAHSRARPSQGATFWAAYARRSTWQQVTCCQHKQDTPLPCCHNPFHPHLGPKGHVSHTCMASLSLPRFWIWDIWPVGLSTLRHLGMLSAVVDQSVCQCVYGLGRPQLRGKCLQTSRQ